MAFFHQVTQEPDFTYVIVPHEQGRETIVSRVIANFFCQKKKKKRVLLEHSHAQMCKYWLWLLLTYDSRTEL